MTTSSDSTAERFAALCARVASSPALGEEGGQVFEAGADAPEVRSLSLILQSLYHHPARVYHSLGHIAACIDTFDRWRHLAGEPDLVEFALFLRALGAPAAIDTVRALILATRHTGEHPVGDEALTADIDMAIVAAAPTDYDAYARAVRTEYAFATDEEFRAGRAAFLRALLARDHIFHTSALREDLESRSRCNIARELADLLRAQA